MTVLKEEIPYVLSYRDYKVGEVVHSCSALALSSSMPQWMFNPAARMNEDHYYFNTDETRLNGLAGVAVSILHMLHTANEPPQALKQMVCLYSMFRPKLDYGDLRADYPFSLIRDVVKTRCGHAPSDENIERALQVAISGAYNVKDVSRCTTLYGVNALLDATATAISHSCAPNTMLLFETPALAHFVCIRPVQKGEKITASACAVVSGPEGRYATRKMVNEKLGYKCNCELCEKPPADDEDTKIRTFFDGVNRDLAYIDFLVTTMTNSGNIEKISDVFRAPGAKALYSALERGYEFCKGDVMIAASILANLMAVYSVELTDSIKENIYIQTIADAGMKWFARNERTVPLEFELEYRAIFASVHALADMRISILIMKAHGHKTDNTDKRMKSSQKTTRELRDRFRVLLPEVWRVEMLWFICLWQFGPPNQPDYTPDGYDPQNEKHVIHYHRLQQLKTMLIGTSPRINYEPRRPFGMRCA